MLGVRSVALLLLSTPICIPASAPAVTRGEGPRLASPQEGEAIVQAAWELRRGLLPKPDCSHFVHAVYTQARFLYTFAGTSDLFAGVEGFRRVTKPQAGDVIVWQGHAGTPGHAGIVIEPNEHSFYSSVNSGFAIQNFQSTYWATRGIPRFYRFVVNNETSHPLLPLNPFVSNLAQPLRAQLPGLIQSGTPKTLAHSGSSESSGLKTSKVRGIQTEKERSIRPTPEDQQVQAQAGSTPASDTRISNQVFVTSRPTPTKDQVSAAVHRSLDGNGERLLEGGSADSQATVRVAESFKIVTINIQGNSGIAELEVTQVGALQQGKVVLKRETTRVNTILSRQEQGWVLVMPQDLAHLDRKLAMTLAGPQATAPSAPDEKSRARSFQ